MEEYSQEEALHIKDYWMIIRRRFWLVLVVFVIAVVTTYVHVSRIKPVYRAKVKVLIERFSPTVLKVDEVLPTDAWSNDFYQTQYEILKSRSLARSVIRSLQLDRHPDFNGKPARPLISLNVRSALASVAKSVLPRGGDARERADTEGSGDPLSPYINAYLGRLRVEPIKNSRLATISFEGHDPRLTAEVANAHARTYIDKNRQMKLSASKEAVSWLATRLKDLRKALKRSEEALQHFQEREDIVTLENILSKGEGDENIIVKRLVELNTKLTDARTERIGLETLNRQLRAFADNPDMKESIPYVIQNSLIQRLKGDLIELTREYSELREKYGVRHPRMMALRREIKGMRSRLSAEVGKIAKSVDIQYRMALAREKSILAELEETKKQVMDLNKKAIQYGVLKREVLTNREIYDMLLKRVKETTLTSGLKSTNIHVVDWAEVPRGPVSPRVNRSVTMAAAIGLLLGLALVFFLEYMDSAIHSPDDIKRHLGVPVIGPVGLASLNGNGKRDTSELAVLRDPRSNFSESLRNVRTNVLFSYAESRQRTLLVTSPGPLEGKTFMSCNLAVALARMGRRVLLIDADMRKPRAHKVFETKARPGLSNLIVGRCTLEEAVRDTGIPLLKLIPSGTIPPNPSELLSSRLMADLVARLREAFEFVVFDSPPILSVTDASIMAGKLDGSLLVLKASETTRESAKRALEKLEAVGARLIGVVLNQVNFQKDRYYYNYYYKYYDYYHSGEGEKSGRRSERPRGSNGDAVQSAGRAPSSRDVPRLFSDTGASGLPS